MVIAFSTNGTDGGGTADERYRFRGEIVAERCLSEIEEEQIIGRYEMRLYWLRWFGAVVGFCRWPGDGRYYLTFKYWRIARPGRIRRQVLMRRPKVILAGFVSGARGRHWKRKRN